MVLDAELADGQKLVFDVNGSEFSLSGPIENLKIVAAEDYTVFRNDNSYLVTLTEDAFDGIFDAEAGSVSVSLFDGEEEIDSADGRYVTYANHVKDVGDVFPVDLALPDETSEPAFVLDRFDTTLAVIEVGALWCAPTIDLAEDFAAYLDLIDREFSPISILIEGELETVTSDAIDAQKFKTLYDLEQPVFAGTLAAALFDPGFIPHFMVVDQVTGEVLKTFSGVEAEDAAVQTAKSVFDALAEIETDGDMPGLELEGSAHSDLMAGSARADKIKGKNGSDEILAGVGNDTVWGQRGNDVIVGERGDDLIKGGNGKDVLYGERGNDVLLGGSGKDILSGGLGKDQLYGKNGDDTLLAGRGADYLYGGSGADRLYSSRGDDTLSGGEGPDSFIFQGVFAQETILDFDGPQDTLLFSGKITAGFDAAAIVSLAVVEDEGVRISIADAGEVFLEGIESTKGLEAAIEVVA